MDTLEKLVALKELRGFGEFYHIICDLCRLCEQPDLIQIPTPKEFLDFITKFFALTRVSTEFFVAKNNDAQYCKAVIDETVDQLEYYQQAADAGDKNAHLRLGHLHYLGLNGITQDYKKAHEHYSIAAKLDVAMAQSMLGEIYQEGKGLSSNDDFAFNWYSFAAKQLDAKGLTGLAMCYLKGKGVKPDAKTAVKYLKQAADKGWAEAQFQLAVLYSEKVAKTIGNVRKILEHYEINVGFHEAFYVRFAAMENFIHAAFMVKVTGITSVDQLLECLKVSKVSGEELRRIYLECVFSRSSSSLDEKLVSALRNHTLKQELPSFEPPDCNLLSAWTAASASHAPVLRALATLGNETPATMMAVYAKMMKSYVKKALHLYHNENLRVQKEVHEVDKKRVDFILAVQKIAKIGDLVDEFIRFDEATFVEIAISLLKWKKEEGCPTDDDGKDQLDPE